MDLIAGRTDASARADAPLSLLSLDADPSEDEPRWPLAARITFITSTTAVLWILIHLATRPS